MEELYSQSLAVWLLEASIQCAMHMQLWRDNLSLDKVGGGGGIRRFHSAAACLREDFCVYAQKWIRKPHEKTIFKK